MNLQVYTLIVYNIYISIIVCSRCYDRQNQWAILSFFIFRPLYFFAILAESDVAIAGGLL